MNSKEVEFSRNAQERPTNLLGLTKLVYGRGEKSSFSDLFKCVNDFFNISESDLINSLNHLHKIGIIELEKSDGRVTFVYPMVFTYYLCDAWDTNFSLRWFERNYNKVYGIS